MSQPWQICLWKPWYVCMSLFETLIRLQAFFGNPSTLSPIKKIQNETESEAESESESESETEA